MLEASGFRVRVPSGRLCCGRPLYDFGMLDRARRYLRQVLDALRADLRAGLAVVVLEPSCLAVFKDELGQLFPDDEDARRLRDQSMLLSQLLLEHAPSFEPTPLGRGRRAPALPSAGAGRRRARHRASRQDRRRGRRSERRLLWSRRLLRLRAGRALRRLDEGRRARAPPRGPPRRRRRWSSRAASPAASRSPTRPTGARSTSLRSSASRSAGGSSRRAARGAKTRVCPSVCRSVPIRPQADRRGYAESGQGRPRGPWPKTRVCPYVSRLRNDSSTVARGRGRVRVAGRRRPRGASARGRGTRGRGFAPRRAALRAPPDQVSARSRPAARRRRRRASSPGRRRARRAGARSSSCAPRIRVHARPSSASLRSSASVTG